jgi:hypothetical protein
VSVAVGPFVEMTVAGGLPKTLHAMLADKAIYRPCKEATDGVSAHHRSNDKIIATRCWRS